MDKQLTLTQQADSSVAGVTGMILQTFFLHRRSFVPVMVEKFSPPTFDSVAPRQ